MMTTKKTMITEIDLYELTEEQFHTLCELIGRIAGSWRVLMRTLCACGIRRETIPLWSGIRRCCRLRAISSVASSASRLPVRRNRFRHGETVGWVIWKGPSDAYVIVGADFQTSFEE